MMVTDANSVILRVNRAFTEMSGCTAGETVDCDLAPLCFVNSPAAISEFNILL
ncbi:MAG: hypothetical protein ABI606_15370 [Rhodoferax sp.]